MLDEAALRRYVLGLAEEPQRTHIEEQIFASDEVFDEVQGVEAEVIDAYVRQELTPSETESFERQIAASERLRREIALARSFHLAAAAHAPVALPSPALERSGRGRWLSIAAGLVAVVAAGLLLTRSASNDPPQAVRNSPTDIVSESTAPARPNPGAITPPPPQEARDPAGVIATLTLSGTLVRSGAPVTELTLPRRDGMVEFQLLLEAGDEYPQYSAQLSSPSGETVWEGASLRVQRTPAGSTVYAHIPSGRLEAGRYEIVLSGHDGSRTSELAVYRFRVKN